MNTLLFKIDVQQWFWKKHLPQMTNGVEGWWGDLGEPERHPTNLLLGNCVAKF